MSVTDDQVRDGVHRLKLDFVANHDCTLCGVAVGWVFDRATDRAWFRSACGCSYSPDRSVPYQDCADWINLQSDRRIAAEIARSFGVVGFDPS